MKLLRTLFSGGHTPGDDAIHLYVRCDRCQSLVHVRIDPRNDLAVEYDDGDDPAGYRLVKEIMDSRCFRLMRAEISYDRGKRELARSLDGGTFITREEYEKQ
ncbi:MAG TPA: hypothetical protein PKA05_03245 [Roseiflexaceae bacterium]|nr:hypothetical protein [Roseiflexaceae bacterium]HMP39374.1 hypothetical protein [Roseiflexaceae bacterium]